MKKLMHIGAHAGVVLSIVFMVFAVLHKFNPVIGFLTNEFSTPLLWAFCVVSLFNAIVMMVLLWKNS